MANDIYGSRKTLAGTFKGTQATLTVGTIDGAIPGALVQNVSLAYNRQVTRILELGSENQYFIIGSSEGQGQIGAILGPKAIIIRMLKELADACKAASNKVVFGVISSFCGDGADAVSGDGELVAEVSGALLTGMNISVSAQDFLVQQGGTFMFTSMNVD